MPGFFSRNIEEIRKDPVLRAYGTLLCLVYCVFFFFWMYSWKTVEMLSNSPTPVCWPFWMSCYKYRFSSPEAVRITLWLYLAVAVAGAGFFAARKTVRWGYGALAALNVFMVVVNLLDFRLFMTHEYMTFFITIPFLYFPAKKNTTRLSLAFYYFAAGFLKLNPNWLNGTILKDYWGWFEGLLPLQCAYVAFLELVGVWGLLSRNKWIFWTVFAQYAVFHVISWHLVTYFYPCVALPLLAIFPLCWFSPAGAPISSFLKGREPRSTYAWIGVFAALNVIPYFGNREDSSLRGGGRMFYGVSMFQEAIECRAFLTLHYKDGSSTAIRFVRGPYGIRGAIARQRCGPLIALNVAMDWCRTLAKDPKFADLDLSLKSRIRGKAEMRTVIDSRNFCSHPPTYRLFGKNSWILI